VADCAEDALHHAHRRYRQGYRGVRRRYRHGCQGAGGASGKPQAALWEAAGSPFWEATGCPMGCRRRPLGSHWLPKEPLGSHRLPNGKPLAAQGSHWLPREATREAAGCPGKPLAAQGSHKGSRWLPCGRPLAALWEATSHWLPSGKHLAALWKPLAALREATGCPLREATGCPLGSHRGSLWLPFWEATSCPCMARALCLDVRTRRCNHHQHNRHACLCERCTHPEV